jgi:hypothetical protein
MIDYSTNKHGNVPLKNGLHVVLTQDAYLTNGADGSAVYEAAGYLSSENPDDETGPTTKVIWDSLGAEESEDDADWDSPSGVSHYARGDISLCFNPRPSSMTGEPSAPNAV